MPTATRWCSPIRPSPARSTTRRPPRTCCTIVKTKKTELLFMALFLRLLKPGGRAAVIVPDGVLFGSSKAHKELRRMLVEDHKLDAMIKLPSRRVPALCGRLDRDPAVHQDQLGGTDHVWFYDVQADGFRSTTSAQPLLAEEKLGPVPEAALSDDEHAKNNLPDVARAGSERDGAERERPRTAQSFCVPKAESRLRATTCRSTATRKSCTRGRARPPKEIIAELKALETEIAEGLDELEAMLK